jgi:hypothetical protein
MDKTVTHLDYFFIRLPAPFVQVDWAFIQQIAA